ncbi:MAG: alpha/beta hydrolase [Halobacteriales archaeon]|nr:alpha/beta hydrolase [Halobacteriales archaeon]
MHHAEWSTDQAETTVEVDDHELSVAYHHSGEGPPVVLLHGIPTWSYLWREVVPALAEDHRVVVPDLLGYGNSAMHDGFDRSIRAQEEMVSALLEVFGIDTAALVGHDIGGSVAMRLAWHEPDRIERLVVSNAPCFDSWPVEFVNGLGEPGAVSGLSDETFEETFAEVFSGGLYGDDPHDEFVEGMLAPWDSPAGRTSLERCAVATNTNHTTEIDYEAITADTLLLWGAADVLQPVDYAERLAAALGGSTTLVGLEEAYHWVVEDRPEAYARELRSFLG